jgi:hypothetical protein
MITFGYRHIVIGYDYVHCREYPGLPHPVKHLKEYWMGILSLHHHLIECVAIYTKH